MNTKTNKYKRDELNCDSDEYKLVKSFYETNISTQVLAPVIRPVVAPDNVKVHKISENYPTTKLDEKRNNLMLFHGTSETNVDGILNKGFINSVGGRFGKGVYMTEDSSVASGHSLKKTSSNTDRSMCNRFIFVNEVLESEKLQFIKYKFSQSRNFDAKPDHKFEKHVINDRKIATDEYKKDAQGRRYRNTANNRLFQQGNTRIYPALDVFLADESLVIPRFLIVIGSDESVRLD